MNSEEPKLVEGQRQVLLGQLRTAEFALRRGLLAHGVSGSAKAQMERALAHIREAYVAIAEARAVRSVAQLVEDLNRVENCASSRHRASPSNLSGPDLCLNALPMDFS
jgi:hypothetical protein